MRRRGRWAGVEACDDGDVVGGDGCSAACEIEGDEPVCGDHVIDAGEACDDGDGCSAACTVEEGWHCDGEPSACCIDREGRGTCEPEEHITVKGCVMCVAAGRAEPAAGGASMLLVVGLALAWRRVLRR